MQESEAREIINQLIQQAQEGVHREVHLIHTLSEYLFYCGQARSLKVVLRVLRNSSNLVFRSYCKGVARGASNLDELLAYQQLQAIIPYYEQELQIVNDMIVEYEDYLFSGNFIPALFGASRGR